MSLIFKVALFPAVHGTTVDLAWKIAGTGFASLSSLDAGYYGKGIYFTSYTNYTIPYIRNTPDPAIIVSLIIPGNAYPIIENPKSPEGFLGKPLRTGYHSHYVCTDKNGFPTNLDEHYDEFVIEQEDQILPLFILEIDKTSIEPKLEVDPTTVIDRTYPAEYLRLLEDREIDLDNSTPLERKLIIED